LGGDPVQHREVQGPQRNQTQDILILLSIWIEDA